MSYVINLTDGTIFAVVADGTINTDSSMTLIGQNFEEYGELVDENFIHLLENSANDTPPGNPLTGQLWWDSANNLLKVYNGSTFKVISASTASSTAPTSNVVGDLWYDTTEQQVKVYTGTTWLVVGPAYSTSTGVTGAIVATVRDTLGADHVIVELYAANAVVATISKDATFTPLNPISGFSTIQPGIQLATVVNSQVPLFQGTATNAQALGGLDSSQYIQRNVNTTTTGSLGILNDNGLTVGTSSNFGVAISGNDVTLNNRISSGNLIFGANVSGIATTVLTINGANGTATTTTRPSGTNDTTLATTAFVTNAVATAKVSPAFTGVPTAPTATFGTDTTQLATTAFVQTAVDAAAGGLGSMSSQNANSVNITGGSISGVTAALTGTPTAPTASDNTNNTQIATTAFVHSYAPSKTGNNASGLWGISVTGSSATASTADHITNPNYNGYGRRTVSTSAPSGGSDGDIWYKI